MDDEIRFRFQSVTKNSLEVGEEAVPRAPAYDARFHGVIESQMGIGQKNQANHRFRPHERCFPSTISSEHMHCTSGKRIFQGVYRRYVPDTRHPCINRALTVIFGFNMRNPLSIDYEPLRCHPGRLDRSLLTELCQCTYSSLSIFLREVVGLKDGVLGTVMRMHRVFPIGRVFLISVKETRCHSM